MGAVFATGISAGQSSVDLDLDTGAFGESINLRRARWNRELLACAAIANKQNDEPAVISDDSRNTVKSKTEESCYRLLG